MPLTILAALPDFKAGVPIAAIFEAFRAHDVVALTDPLGDVQVQALLLSRVRDRRFPTAVNDIVIETARCGRSGRPRGLRTRRGAQGARRLFCCQYLFAFSVAQRSFERLTQLRAGDTAIEWPPLIVGFPRLRCTRWRNERLGKRLP